MLNPYTTYYVALPQYGASGTTGLTIDGTNYGIPTAYQATTAGLATTAVLAGSAPETIIVEFLTSVITLTV